MNAVVPVDLVPLAQAEGRPFFRWDWVLDHLDDIGVAALEHLVLTGAAVGLGLVLAAGLTLWSLRSPRAYGIITGAAGILYSIPSLAAFAFLVPFLGLTMASALIPLTTYTLLILVRNAVTGIQGVDAAVVEAARGMGHTEAAILLRVRLPLAVPVIVAGIRVATVTTVGLVTVTALIGYGGLGSLILSGIRRSIAFPTEIIVGTLGAVVLATALDALLLLLQRLLTPWRQRTTG